MGMKQIVDQLDSLTFHELTFLSEVINARLDHSTSGQPSRVLNILKEQGQPKALNYIVETMGFSLSQALDYLNWIKDDNFNNIQEAPEGD